MSRTKPRSFEHLPDTSFACLAGWIDGEGCLSVMQRPYRTRGYYSVRLTISQSHEGLMHWLSDNFGGTWHKGTGGTNQAMYYWICSCADLDYVLTRCMPFLIVKKE